MWWYSIGIRQVVVDGAAAAKGSAKELHHVRHAAEVPLEVEAVAAVLHRPGDAAGDGRVLGDEDGLGMLLLHRLAHRLHEAEALRVVAVAVRLQESLVLFLGRELVVVKLAGRIEAEAVDVEFLDPVKQARDQETLHLVAGEVEVVGAPGRALAVGNGALEEVIVVVVAGQAGCILGKVDQHQVEDDADSLAVKGVDEPLEVGGRSQPRGGGKEADDLVAPGGDVGMLEDAHQLDVRVLHVLDVGDQLVDQLQIAERPAILEAPRQGMDLVDVERSAKLVRAAGPWGA